MKFTIKPQGGAEASLCHSCDDGFITEDDRGRQTIKCGYFGGRAQIVPRPIVQCSKYTRIGSFSLHEMKQVAWTLEVEAKKVIGFKPPKRRTIDMDDEL